MKKIVVIVAGGTGSRMGKDVPKQFLLLKNKPILWHSIHTFLSAFDDMQIVVVAHKDHFEKTQEIIDSFNANERISLAAGGATRYDSVKSGLQKIAEPAIIFVHDAVRCLVSETLIRSCFQQALEKGSAVPAVISTDSIRIEIGTENKFIDRETVRIIQTPQTFRSEILLPAFEQPYNMVFTDEANVVEHSGKPVFLIEGNYANIKITRPVDIAIAEFYMNAPLL